MDRPTYAEMRDAALAGIGLAAAIVGLLVGWAMTPDGRGRAVAAVAAEPEVSALRASIPHAGDE